MLLPKGFHQLDTSVWTLFLRPDATASIGDIVLVGGPQPRDSLRVHAFRHRAFLARGACAQPSHMSLPGLGSLNPQDVHLPDAACSALISRTDALNSARQEEQRCIFVSFGPPHEMPRPDTASSVLIARCASLNLSPQELHRCVSVSFGLPHNAESLLDSHPSHPLVRCFRHVITSINALTTKGFHGPPVSVSDHEARDPRLVAGFCRSAQRKRKAWLPLRSGPDPEAWSAPSRQAQADSQCQPTKAELEEVTTFPAGMTPDDLAPALPMSVAMHAPGTRQGQMCGIFLYSCTHAGSS